MLSLTLPLKTLQLSSYIVAPFYLFFVFELKPNATWFVCQIKLTNSLGSLVRNTFIDVN